jgi:hypothetical protein
MKSLPLVLTTFICLSIISCSNNANPKTENFPFMFSGVIEKTGITTYMYGSHTISNNGEKYALQSTTINLDNYINKKVTIKGSKVEGYPVEDGPELIDVKAVEVK